MNGRNLEELVEAARARHKQLMQSGHELQAQINVLTRQRDAAYNEGRLFFDLAEALEPFSPPR